MKNTLLIHLLFFAAILPASAFHTGTLEGVIYDSDSRIELAGARISLLPAALNTYTNDLGHFTFRGLEEGEYQLIVNYIGFAPDTISNLQILDGETRTVKVFLESRSLDLPEVQIESDPNFFTHSIAAIDIQTRPLNNAQEVLRMVPGLFLAQHAGGGKAEQLFLRGFDIDHGTDIRITVDDIPVNMVSHAHGQGYADLHFVIPELIRKVEFRKGPYYADAGNFSTAGSVALQTANALDESFIKMEAGQFDQYRVVGALDLLGRSENKNQHAYAAAELNYNNGYFDAPQQFQRVNFLTKYNTLINDKQSLTATFSAFTSRWDASGQVPERAVKDGTISRFGAIDPTEGGQTSRLNFNLEYLSNLNSGLYSQHQFFVSKYNFELYSDFTFFLEDPENGDQIRQKEDRLILGYNGKFWKESTLAGAPFTTTLGWNIRHDQVSNDELSHTVNRQATLENLALGDVRETNAAVFLQSEWKPIDKLQIQAGLRFDQFIFSYDNHLTALYDPRTIYDRTLSPKLNLHYNLSPAVQLFALSGVGFHSNDTRVVTAQDGRETLPKALGWEGGAILKPFEALILQAAYWQLGLEQEFVYVGDAGIVEPSGKTLRRGVDFSARLQLAKWLYADADINYSNGRSTEEEKGMDYIPLAPRLTSTGGLSARWDNGFEANIRYRHLSDRPANEDNSLIAKGYFLLDSQFQWRSRQFMVGFGIQNLLNSEWKEAQFETESRLRNEPEPVTEIHFTPGTPFNLRGFVSYYF